MENNITKIEDLNIKNKGTTLNEQDIDLMMIANSSNIEELKKALEKITNINYTISEDEINQEQFQNIRQKAFKLYMKSLTPRNDYYKDNNIQLGKKIEYLTESGIFDSEELKIFKNILKENKGDINKILSELSIAFSEEKNHQIFQTMNDYSPIEKTGIIGTDIETYQRMFKELDNYNSITLDESAKYGSVALADGTFDFRHLQKVLDFAKNNGKQVRLNTLLFYMDCPEELYKLDPTQEENKDKVLETLKDYIGQITDFINKNGYTETVRSIDVFNELLNRFPMNGDTPYQYRGYIYQDSEAKDFDNIKSGWLKFLDVEDLCEAISVARKNLPDTDFMYNDDNLIDPDKIEANTIIIDRIKQYEEENNIKLINSIGTQMHIDDSVEKKDIIKMFDNLSQYKLPIEITEFDMAMVSNNLKGLSRVDIHNLKIQKMYEVFNAINECKEKDNIRGFTIWSKTDEQNFRVALVNEQRVKNREKPIKTLQGGFYNKDMTLKKERKKFQDFNYHTHTYRSGHSEYVSDEEMLKAAKEADINMLGFSEHVPNPDFELPDENHRMMSSEVDEYIESINKLKEDNTDMTILIGFEAEFSPMKEAYLGEIREKVDYLILGQHFVNDGMRLVQKEGNPEYPLKYADMVCKGIESGLFDIVAHPDCFMELRDTISDENKAKYEENCIKASRQICQAAAKMQIPLEINLGNALNNKKLKDGNLGIPHPLFWEIANEEFEVEVKNGNETIKEKRTVKVLKGTDAHTIQAFEDLDLAQERIANIENIVSDKMIKGPYNPVDAREANTELKEAYKKHQENALTYETYMVNQIVNGTLAKVSDELDSKNIAGILETTLNKSSEMCDINADKKIQKIESEIPKSDESQETSTYEKISQPGRKQQAINETNKVLNKQKQIIKNATYNVDNAINIGCESKEDYSNMITKMTQQQTTKNEIQKMRIDQEIANFQKSKTDQKVNSQNNEKPKVMTKTNNSQGNNSSSKGFSYIMTLALIVSFICGALFMIVYMLINK